MSKNYKIRKKVHVKGSELNCKDTIDGFLLDAEKTLTILKSNETLTKEELEKEKILMVGEFIDNIHLNLFNDEKELIRFKNTMIKNLIFNYGIPLIKDEIIKKGDISFIWSVGRALNKKNSRKLIYEPREVSYELKSMLECRERIPQGSSVALDYFFANNQSLYKYRITYVKKEEAYYTDVEALQKEMEVCFNKGMDYMLDCFSQDGFESFIKSFLKKFQKGYHLNVYSPEAVSNETLTRVFKSMLSQLLPYIKNEDLKSEVQLEILLN